MISNRNPQQSDPAYGAFLISPDDALDLAKEARAVYIGSDGDLRVLTVYGEDVLFTGLVAGTVLPVSISRVFETNTTATGLVGLY